MTMAFTPDALRKLPVSDRLRLIEELWASLAVEPDALDVPQWHREELDRRLDGRRRDPLGALDWQAVRAELRKTSQE